MSRFTYASLFTGGDGWGVGLRAAGGRGLWGVELDPLIAAVATQNGAHGVLTADVLSIGEWGVFAVPDVLVISQPCTRMSAANTGAAESPLDIALARAALRAIAMLQPRLVLIENVPAFARSVSCALLCDGLWAAGYWAHGEVVNAADFGVPQTRHRYILRAVRGGYLPRHPAPVPWVGWYAAIADLIPTLPPDQFANWQLKRLNATYGTQIIGGGNTSDASLDGTWHSTARPVDAPMFTVSSAGQARAFLAGVQGEHGDGWYGAPAPAPTITAAHRAGKYRAFLVEGTGAGDDRPLVVRHADEPMWTVRSAHRTDTARAWLDTGRVVRMTARALSRFQSVPDSYILPDNGTLAMKVIGNMVPALLAQRLIEPLVAAPAGTGRRAAGRG